MAIQTSSGSTRERWVKALLPAALIVMVYMLLINVGNSREIKSLTEDLEEQRETAVTEDDLASTYAANQAVARERDELNERIAQMQSQIDAAVAEFTGGSPAERMMRIDRLCSELSIAVLQHKPATKVETSKTREESLKTLQSLVPPDSLNYRELEVVARYADMVALMRRLPETVPGLVPLGVELLKDDSSEGESSLAAGERTWRIYVLM